MKKSNHKHMKLHTKITILVCAVVFISLVASGYLIGTKTTKQTKENYADRVMNIAKMMSKEPLVADMTGLELLMELRKEKNPVDIIMITAANDNHTVQTALHYGISDYLIKPFTFDRFKAALEKYKETTRLLADKSNVSQDDIDRFFYQSKNGSVHTEKLPKGMTKATLHKVIWRILNRERAPFSTSALAEELGISRVSVRKYIHFLTVSNLLNEDIIYQQTDRPAASRIRNQH